MKCPKCGYLGFEAVDRCRNCGYEFSLSSESSPPELPMRSPAESSGSATDGADLPLFRASPPGDSPLAATVPPRPPLAVRRATPQVPRPRPATPSAPLLDLATAERAAARERDAVGEIEVATLTARVAAVAIDLSILAAIDAVVVYFTMKICGLTLDEFGTIPKGPLAAFLLFQNAAYLVAFTAGGQTLGKMATGIRIVSATSSGPLDLGRSIVRTMIWALLAVPAGLGFLTTILRADHRGLHDRCAGTRVVRATT
jgi:uncharacterized RDD family membrane protein YckC